VNVLSADTSTERLTVSVTDEKRILATYNSGSALRHSSLLVPLIKKAMDKAGIRREEIGLLAVGLGPGSFTGLRVGLTTMRTMAIALNRPIVGIPSMDAMASNGLAYLKRRNLLSYYGSVCTVIDARKNNIYACLYRIDGSGLKRETKYFLGRPSVFKKKLIRQTLLLGDRAVAEALRKGTGRNRKTVFAEGCSWMPKASTIGRLALERYNARYADNPYTILPLYLYPDDCNVNRKIKRKVRKLG